MWGLHAWGPRGSDPTAGEVTAADPVPQGTAIGAPTAVATGAKKTSSSLSSAKDELRTPRAIGAPGCLTQSQAAAAVVVKHSASNMLT